MRLYEAALDDCNKDMTSPVGVWDSNMVRKFISKLSSEPSMELTMRQISYGEDTLHHFLSSDDPDYSLFNGKSQLILALSLYCSMLPDNARMERHKLICEKIWSEKALVLSETVYNDLESGRAGILFALTYFYILRPDDGIREIISNLLLLMISDARFYKKSITWFRSDLVQNREELFFDNRDVILALSYVNSIFRNEFLGMLIASVLTEAPRFDSYKLDKTQQPGSHREVKSPPNFAVVEREDHRLELKEWFGVLERLTNSSASEKRELNFCLDSLTKFEGFSTLIKNNFFEFAKEMPSNVIDSIISELTRSCSDLNQYRILNILKATRIEKGRAKFRIIFRRLRLRVEIIDKSEILVKGVPDNSIFYKNCTLFADMTADDLFTANLTINQNGVFYRLINSNWLYSYNYEKKRLIGCFSVKRYDKSIFVNTELLDGFLPRLFMYLSARGACVSQFKTDILDNLNLEINEEHFRNRLLLLIRQGILIPTDGSSPMTSLQRAGTFAENAP